MAPLTSYQIVVPSESIALKFNQQVMPLVDMIRANIHQSRTLAELRDTLLSKLVSGELRVPGVSRSVQEAENALTGQEAGD